MANKKVKKKESEEVKEVRKDLRKSVQLFNLATSEGGKMLVEHYTKKIVSIVEILAGKHSSLTHPEFIAKGVQLMEHLEIIRTLTRSGDSKKIHTEELKKLLEDPLQE